MRREDVPYLVSRLMGGRPARWAPVERTLGDYDGRERTLEVFNAAPKDQLGLLAALRSERANLKGAAGGAIVFIFHTEEESARLYAEFVGGFPLPPNPPSLRAETASSLTSTSSSRTGSGRLDTRTGSTP